MFIFQRCHAELNWRSNERDIGELSFMDMAGTSATRGCYYDSNGTNRSLIKRRTRTIWLK
ncbi:hypothetical protein LINGRAHAP2_LOCUS16675 [Linum grandiflorum]